MSDERSLALIEAAIPSCSGWTSPAREVVTRMVGAAGDLALAGLTRVHPEAVEAALDALANGAPVACDGPMVAAGLVADGRPVAVRDFAVVTPDLNGGLVVIGEDINALRHLTSLVARGEALPAAIIATPAGFDGAAEAKQALLALDVPSVVVEGSRGGPSLAVAAANALLQAAASAQG